MKDTFDETVLDLGVPSLLRHAAEAHQREIGKLKQELNALRRLLGQAAAACVADIQLDAPVVHDGTGASASANWKAPTILEGEAGSSSFAPANMSTKLGAKEILKEPSRSPSVRTPATVNEVDESKWCSEPEGLKELAKLTDQLQRIEDYQKDLSAKQLAEIGGIKMRQIMQQAELERVKKEKDPSVSENNSNRKNSPTPSMLSVLSRRTDRDGRISVGNFTNGAASTRTMPPTATAAAGAVPSSLDPPASATTMLYEAAFPQPAPVAAAKAVPVSPTPSSVLAPSSTGQFGPSQSSGSFHQPMPTSPSAAGVLATGAQGSAYPRISRLSGDRSPVGRGLRQVTNGREVTAVVSGGGAAAVVTNLERASRATSNASSRAASTATFRRDQVPEASISVQSNQGSRTAPPGPCLAGRR